MIFDHKNIHLIFNLTEKFVEAFGTRIQVQISRCPVMGAGGNDTLNRKQRTGELFYNENHIIFRSLIFLAQHGNTNGTHRFRGQGPPRR